MLKVPSEYIYIYNLFIYIYYLFIYLYIYDTCILLTDILCCMWDPVNGNLIFFLGNPLLGLPREMTE